MDTLWLEDVPLGKNIINVFFTQVCFALPIQYELTKKAREKKKSIYASYMAVTSDIFFRLL